MHCEDVVISLSAKGLTTGEVQAHLAEVYGAQVSRQTISTITDKVIEGMAEWQNRPLDPVYPVIFIDAINVKIRDGKVANRPIYVALAITCEGHRDILGFRAGDGGEGAKHTGCTCSTNSRTAASTASSWSSGTG
jgi:transposase-like protein